MPVDPNIALQVQAPQIANPLDMAMKAQNLQQLAYQNQAQQRELGDQQALRDAYQKNMTQGPDGAPKLNMQGLVADVSARNPMLGMKIQKEQEATDLQHQKDQLEVIKARHEQLKDIAWSVPTDPNTPMEVKQAAHTAAKQKAIQLGIPGADKWPDQYMGDDATKAFQLHTLDQKEQFERLKDERDSAYKRQDLEVRRQTNAGVKQNQAMDSVSRQLESARGNPAAAQAEKDIYAAQKVKTLIGQVGDPNNMNMQMVHLLTSEVGKIASGGVPTVEELKGLTPGALPQGLSVLAEKFNNHPTAANAGAFVKQFSDYADAVAKDGQRVIEDKYGRIIETNKARLGSDNYSALKKNYTDRFKTADQSPGGTVQMQAPDGTIRAVPANQVDAAIKAGGKRL